MREKKGNDMQQMVMGDSCVGHMFYQLSCWSAACTKTSRLSDTIFI